ncbi:MAG: 2-isopropylmalate synthase, partial [Balneolaceae bacterium]
MDNHIKIFDTTLRDGEQSPGYSMNKQEKLQLALQLERLGVDVIEAGFPIASDGDYETVKEIGKIIKKSSVAALCRTRQVDIERAISAVQYAAKPRIHTFIATSDIHLKYKLQQTRKEVIDSAVKAVKYARSHYDDVEFSAEDASRSDPDYLIEIFTAVIDAGATTINIPDTVGYALPWEYGELIKTLHDGIPNIDQAIISVHCHNDLGLAVANSLMAIQNGARQIECTVNGIGERAGNASLEEIVMTLKTRKNSMDYTTSVNTKEIYPSSQLLSQITGKGVQPNKAIVGENAFAHEAGIHQHGVLKNPLTYEIMTPESV